MSMSASIDGRDAGQVATNSGWYDFVRWVDEIEDVPALRQVTEYGSFEGDLSELEADLQAAIDHADPTPDQQSISDGLIAILERAGEATVFIVSDGAGESEGDED